MVLSETPSSQGPAGTRPEIQLTQEMRFAVVMYGGTSLAIYINGVVQELLALVRATAPETLPTGEKVALYTEDELRPVERVYRRLGQLVGWGATGTDVPKHDAPIRTRFVIDILSGTSAGGLNAIYLGKALANEQDITSLKALWRDQADLSLLVNDKDSLADTGLELDKPRTSVLNSKRMYWQLLSALDGMDTEREPAPSSRLVDELDCWITATDIRGLLMPIDLFDRFVFERRHRKVFHFVLRTQDDGAKRNDFQQKANPFLAFAGRCTSAFPFAFEPMQLADIDVVVKDDRFRDTYGDSDSTSPSWQRFFDEYLKPGGAETLQEAAKAAARVDAYRTASFGDGGYLDNKPFTYATQALAQRRATVPVDRRLIYVEPDPHDRPPVERLLGAWRAHGPLADLPERSPERPNALENVVAALLKLPRAETIREDVEQLLKQNRDLERLTDLACSVDIALRSGDPPDPFPPPAEWRAMSAQEWMKGRGLQFAAYYRLHFASVLDDLARTVTRAAGFDENSDEEAAIRCFVQAWANRYYSETKRGKRSQNNLLARIDIEYRIRRIAFLQHRIDEILRFDWTAMARLADFGLEARDGLEGSREVVAVRLRRVKAALDQTLGDLRAAGSRLWVRTESGDNPLLPLLGKIAIDRRKLMAILDGAHSREEAVENAERLLDEPDFRALDRVADRIADELAGAFVRARRQVGASLRVPRRDPGGPVATALRALRSDFELYYAYDSIIFPVSYGHLGEANSVKVIRISPEDAPSIVDELEGTRRKLAGTGVNHFGGFLDERWRRNDMLWGRLDAAERIIETVAYGAPSEVRQELLEEAHLAIIGEEFAVTDEIELSRQLVDIALATRAADAPELDAAARARLEGVVSRLRRPKEILEFMKRADGYEVNRQLDLDRQLHTAGRAAVVTGAVLDGISENPRVRVGTRWLARVGRIASGLAELASPGFPRKAGRYWFFLALALSIAMIILGLFLTSPETTHVGWVFFFLLLGLALTTWVLRDLFDRRSRELAIEPRVEPKAPPPPLWRRLLSSRIAWVGAVAIVAVITLAVVEVVAHLGNDLENLFDL